MSLDGDEWYETTIAELGRVITGTTPPTKRPELYGSEYPFITPTDIQQGSRAVETARFVSEEGRKGLERRLLPTKAVCFVCIGATIGKSCMTTRPSFTNQQINSVVVDENRHDSGFIYYLLRHEAERIKSLAGGAATPIISKGIFSAVTVCVPPLPTQRKIAAILSAYDDLIENNTRRIAVLEEMAQALYREWFVRFRFPGHEQAAIVDSELGPIPEGWEIADLGDIADVRWGNTSITKKSYVEEGFDAYSASGLDGKLPRYEHDHKGVVLSAIGANCGRTWFAEGKWSCIKNTIRFWATFERVSTEYLFFATMGKDYWPRRGAAQPFISQGDARRCPVLVPTDSLLNWFSNFAGNNLSQTRALRQMNSKLRQIRDLLLPRLVSGEVDVSDLSIDGG